jgi:hypothetical protein
MAKVLLPDVQGQLAQIASWADDVRRTSEWAWTAPLHFVNTPSSGSGMCTYSYSRDCQDTSGTPNFCVCGALNHCSDILSGSSQTPILSLRGFPGRLATAGVNESLADALKFLVHFVGDSHQPLHCGKLDDKGGNDITVHFFGKKTNLHSVWDTAIIDKRMDDSFSGSRDAYAQHLTERLGKDWAKDISKWEKCTASSEVVCPDPWATESVQYACSTAYAGAPDNANLTSPYYNKAFPVVDLRLAQAAVRMAAALNRLWK